MGAMQQSLLATAAAVAATLDTVAYSNRGLFSENIAALTVTPPLSYIDGDLIVLVLASVNQTISDPTTGGTWTQVSNSPQGTGTAGAVQSIQCKVYQKIASGPQANAAVADSGVLTLGQMFCFRKVDSSTPIEVTAGSVLATAGTTHTLPAVTTSTNNAMVAHCTGIGRDSSQGANYSSPTNANLTGLTVRSSQSTATANGGGIGLVTGTKTTAGASGTTSVTVGASAKGAFITLGIKPSTNYDNSVRVYGSTQTGELYTEMYDQVYNSGQATALITLNSDGSITSSGNLLNNPRSTWLFNSTSGSSYWVRATTLSGTGTGTTGSWLQLNTNRTWSVDAIESFSNWQIKLEFSTDSGGSTIVATNTVDLTAESNIGDPP